uniref:CHAT domain-containing tetratricopeptide repeat protein n=1 Tax=Paractinoplanes polyasparticus TaxID=2856853 RepID=UPI001C856087|nr:CHAT domain-containing protein [Actinoplanes polyasparticus]
MTDEAAELTLQAVALLQGGGLDRQRMDSAVAMLRRASAATPANSPHHAGRLTNLSGALHSRYLMFGEADDLTECVTFGRAAAEAADPDSEAFAICQTNLAACLRLRFDRWNVPVDLDDSIEAGRAAVGATGESGPQLAVRLSNLANGLRTRGEESGGAEDIRQAAAYAVEAYEHCPDGHPSRAAIASNVSMSLYARYRWTGDVDDLQSAVTAGRDCLAAAPADSRAGAIRRSNTGLMIRDLGRRLGRADLCDEAVTMTEHAVRLVARHGVEHEANLTMVRQSAGLARLARFDLTGQPDDLESGVRWARDAVAAATIGTPAARAWHHLCNALQTRAEWLGDPEQEAGAGPDAAIEAGETAVRMAGDRYPEQATLLSTLSAAYRLRFEIHGRAADVVRAVDLSRTALEKAADGRSAARRSALSCLGVALQSRFKANGSADDIGEAVTVLRTAHAIEDGSAAVTARHNLASALLRCFDIDRDPAMLDESIGLAVAAADETAPGERWRPARLTTLSMALRTRAELTGNRGDADRAVAIARQAWRSAFEGEPRHAALAGLAVTLQTRYGLTVSLPDLDEAIRVGWEVLDAVPPGHADRPGHLSNQGSALHDRFSARSVAADLDAAVDCLRAAVAAELTRAPDRPGRLGNLSSALRERYALTGDEDDLADAVTAARQALADTPPGHQDRPRYQELLGLALEYAGDLDEARTLLAAAVHDSGTAGDRIIRLSNQGGLLLRVWERTGSVADLDGAIRAAREATAGSRPDDPYRLTYLSNTGAALHRRYDATGDSADRAAAIEAYREVAGSTIAPAAVRAAAARGEAMLAADQQDWSGAAAAARTSLELAGRTADRALSRADQERLLAPGQGLASLAAACALNDAAPETALELLEAGRGVLLSQLLDLRADVGDVGLDRPDLATRFAELRDRLDTAAPAEAAPAPRSSSPVTGLAAVRAAEGRRALTEELDRVIEEIRTVPGHERFLMLPTGPELRRAAADGPIVLLNVHRLRSDALIVHPGGVTPVPLPAVTPAAVAEQTRRLLTAVGVLPRDDPMGAREAEDEVAGVLAWLRDAIAEAVLAALGSLPRRLWWCPVGSLSYLPLHAAVLDQVVSSYTPTVRALIRARSASPDTAPRRLAAVAMPRTPDATPLRHVAAEAAAVARHFPGTHTVLTGPAATHRPVVAALSRATWAHLACHAVSDLAEPSRSRLLLHDHREAPLTVLDVIRLRLTGAELAYLSACSTSLTGPALPDEAIHLASAFQLAGYRHVIGTLWPVGDRVARRTAEAVYSAIDKPGDCAYALHAASLAARARRPGSPTWWAATTHFGA